MKAMRYADDTPKAKDEDVLNNIINSIYYRAEKT